MSIWFQTPTIEDLEERGENTLTSLIGIKITKIGDDFLEGTMPVDKRTIQPLGLLHGGASCVLAESLGSIAANIVLDHSKEYAVGLEINANHIRSAKSGVVTGVATPIHIGRKTQIWDIKIKNEEGKLTCISRLTMAVISKEGK
ncbi:MAG: hotdog fold thioesterase [Deltaproteobacteria bacterium]|nr:MAG: hotdog fold thioesterase [Deltaproteobacteria bacterium]